MRFRGIVTVPAILAASVLCAAPLAHAATLTRGTIEITPTVSFSRNSFSFNGSDAGTLTNFAGSGLLGYCFTDRFEVVGGLRVDYLSLDDPSFPSESETSIGLLGGVQYNFASAGNTIPFARAAIGFATHSGDLAAGEETTILAPLLDVGLRVLVGSSASVNFGIGYRHHSDALGVRDVSANTFAAEIGVSIFPGR